MTELITLKRLQECPELLHTAARWFSRRWGVPEEAYRESMEESLLPQAKVPRWYLALNDKGEIVAGAGIIDNDFHDRKDLTPNLCALFVEEPYRCRGIAGKLLSLARRDCGEMGFDTLYLVTDHTSFYEKYGWTFLTMVKGDDGSMERLYQAPAL